MLRKPFVSFFKRTVSCGSLRICTALSVLLLLTLGVWAQSQTPAQVPNTVAATAAVASAATAPETEQSGPRRIAVILPLTGKHASMGVLLQQGYTLGEVVIKESVLKNAEVRYFDSGKANDIETLVKDQVAPWKPDVIVGPYTSEEALALDQVATTLKIPVVTPAATIDKLNQSADGVVYRICPPQYKMAETAASFMENVWNDWGIDKVVILTEENPFGRQASQALVGSFASHKLLEPEVQSFRAGDIQKTIDGMKVADQTVIIMLGRSTDDARKVVNKFEKTNRIMGLYGAFTTPEFRLYASAQAADVHKGLYVVTPWQSEQSNSISKAFDTRFRNMFKDALDRAIPLSHSTQAYTAMLAAGNALADARDNNTDVFTALNTLIMQSPMGEIRFIDYGGYHRQTTVAAAVQQYQGTLPRVVYPVAAKKAETPPAAKKERGAIRTLLENQLLALFAILGLGLALGAISFRGISLGSSGVLFIALIFGHYGLSIPNKIGTLGLILFVYGVGLGAGPGFFRAFVTQGKNLAKMGAILVGVGAVCTYVCARVFDIPCDLSVGIFAGSMTSTPALAAAIDMLKDSGPLASIGYGVAYPFGVVGVVLFVQLLPKIMGVDLDKLSTEITQQTSKSKMIMRVLVEITNPAVVGKHLVDLDFISRNSCQVVRVKKDQRMIPLTPDLILEAGEKVLVVGKEENLKLIVEFLGKRSDEPFFMDADRERRTVVVTSSAIVGRSLRGLDVLRKYGVSVSRIVRNDASFVPNADTIIQRADALTIVGEPENMERFSEEAGHRAKALEQTDLLSLAIGIVLGIILGTIPLGLGTGSSFALGMTGGPLFVALILGHFGRLGFLTGYMPRASRLFMTELGLVFFLMGAGVKAGGAFIEVVQTYGIKLFIMGVIVTSVPMIIGYPVARKLLKLNLLQTLGGTCGGMTSTPGLGAITAKTDSDIPVVSYATAYPVALILMTIFAQLVISLLS
jgi:putative transport protein